MFYVLNLCIPLPPTAPKLWYFCRVAEGLASRACPLLWFPVVPLVLVLIHVSSQEGLGPAGMEITEQQDQLREMQACALLPQQLDLKKKISINPAAQLFFLGFPRMSPLASNECQLPLRIKLSLKKKNQIKQREHCQSELYKCSHLAPSSNWASRFALLKRKLASLDSNSPKVGELIRKVPSHNEIWQ